MPFFCWGLGYVVLLHFNFSMPISLDIKSMKVSIVWCMLLGIQVLLEESLKMASSNCSLFASFGLKCAESFFFPDKFSMT